MNQRCNLVTFLFSDFLTMLTHALFLLTGKFINMINALISKYSTVYGDKRGMVIELRGMEETQTYITMLFP